MGAIKMSEEKDNFLAVVEEPQTQITKTTGTEMSFFDLPDPELIAKRAENTKKVMAAVCKCLSYKDITNHGGNPYIDHYGMKKIANLFGLIVRQDEFQGRINYRKEMRDETTNEYTVYITGKVYHKDSPDNYEIYEGSASSFDDFFRQWQIVEEKTVTENGKEKTKKQVVSAIGLPESKVQEKATANLIQRAVKKKLGFQLSWEDLEQFGFDKSKCKGFNFNSAGSTDSSEIAEKKQEVWKKIVDICNGDVELAKKTLAKHTAFKDFKGHTDINKVSESQLSFLEKTVDKAYKEWLQKMENKEVEE